MDIQILSKGYISFFNFCILCLCLRYSWYRRAFFLSRFGTVGLNFRLFGRYLNGRLYSISIGWFDGPLVGWVSSRKVVTKISFLNGPVARICRFHRHGRGSIPRWGIIFYHFKCCSVTSFVTFLECNTIISFGLSTVN